MRQSTYPMGGGLPDFFLPNIITRIEWHNNRGRAWSTTTVKSRHGDSRISQQECFHHWGLAMLLNTSWRNSLIIFNSLAGQFPSTTGSWNQNFTKVCTVQDNESVVATSNNWRRYGIIVTHWITLSFVTERTGKIVTNWVTLSFVTETNCFGPKHYGRQTYEGHSNRVMTGHGMTHSCSIFYSSFCTKRQSYSMFKIMTLRVVYKKS